MKTTISNRILIFSTLIVIFFGTVASLFVFYYAGDILKNNLEENSKSLIIDKSRDLDAALKDIQYTITKLAGDEMIVSYIEEPKKYKYGDMVSVLKGYQHNDHFLAVYIMDKTGLVISTTDERLLQKDFSYRNYFVDAISGKHGIDVAFGAVTNELGLYFSKPIKNKEGEIFSVAVIKIDPTYLSELLNFSNITKDLEVMLIDNFGIVFYSTNNEDLFKSIGSISEIKKETANKERYGGKVVDALGYDDIQNNLFDIQGIWEKEIYDDEDKALEYLNVSKIDGFPFYIVFEKKLNEAMQPITDLTTNLGLFVLATTVLSVLIIFLVVRRILKPFGKINKKIEEIGNGNYSVDTKIETNIKEFNNLDSAINIMIKKIKESDNNTKREVIEKTKELVERDKYLEEQRKSLANILEDIDIEKQRAENLASDLQKFKLAVDSVSDHIVITDQEGIVLYGNKAIKRITGYDPEEAIGKKAGTLWKAPMSDEFYKNFWDTIKNKKQTFIGEIRNKRKNGELYDAVISVSPVLNKVGEIAFFVGVERDITEHKKIDRAKTEFVSIASHQLRTPLSTMNWYTEMLLDGDVGKLNKKQKDYLGEVYRGSKRMGQLVTALLNVSRIDLGTFAIDPQPTNIIEISQEIIKELSQKIEEKKLKVKEFYDNTIPVLLLDQGLTRIIFQNLISNAVKYTGENGTVEVTIKREGNDIFISVRDTGYGIPEIAKEKIFSKLYRADNVRDKEVDGNGLGLYIVKAIIEEIGGKIWFDSKENEGTTFYVTFSVEGMKKKEGAKALTTKGDTV
ncbi:MAG: ATP-binding protein [Patescibacteria group bacterium]